VLQQKSGSSVAVPASAPTTETSFYVVRYSSSDRSGNMAVKLRRVHFVCALDERVCDQIPGDLTCSLEGICSTIADSAADEEPGQWCPCVRMGAPHPTPPDWRLHAGLQHQQRHLVGVKEA